MDCAPPCPQPAGSASPDVSPLSDSDVVSLRALLKRVHSAPKGKDDVSDKIQKMLLTEAYRNSKETKRHCKRQQDASLIEGCQIRLLRQKKLKLVSQARQTRQLLTDTPFVKGSRYCSYKALENMQQKNVCSHIAPSDVGSEVLPTPLLRETSFKCYVCKRKGRDVSGFYDSMCPTCGEMNHNWRYRYKHVNLNGKVAIVTGCRIKIGFEITRMLLKSGCIVLGTTRFPGDARSRFQNTDLTEREKDMLQIMQLDLRSSEQISSFTSAVKFKFPKIDILINNAAQTIKRDDSFYSYEREKENSIRLNPLEHTLRFNHVREQSLSGATFTTFEAETAHTRELVADTCAKPVPHDENGQPLDLRPTNSWVLPLQAVNLQEVAEVQLVNYIAPYQLISELHSALKRVHNNTDFATIVNVSSMEGKFHDHFKSRFHPHTNAAKAALNMLVRTSSDDFRREGILFTAVDTGWVTEMTPNIASIQVRHTPLDEIDGAARVLHPVFEAYSTSPTYYSGVFLKDYKVTTW